MTVLQALIVDVTTPLPKDTKENHRDIAQNGCCVCVSKNTFLTTISKHVPRYGTLTLVINTSGTQTIFNALRGLNKILLETRIRNQSSYGGFIPLMKTKLAGMGITLNIAARDKHVPDIESDYHCISKEICRAA